MPVYPGSTLEAALPYPFAAARTKLYRLPGGPTAPLGIPDHPERVFRSAPPPLPICMAEPHTDWAIGRQPW